MLKNNFNVVLASRGLSLLNVAIYDATIAAWDSKYAHNRPRPAEYDRTLGTLLPTPRSPSYPSEHAAVAGAAAAVLGYLFPADAAALNARSEQAGLSRLLAGVHYASDVAAGLDLGRTVGGMVVERARADGASAPWTGMVPSGPGVWNGSSPLMPQAATWKPWVLDSPDQLRPQPPYAYDSPEKAAEMAELRSFARTPKTNSDAFFWEYAAGGTRVFQFWTDQVGRKVLEYGLGANPPLAARAYATATVAFYDAMVACWDAKYAYWAIRPFQLDPDFKPLFATPNHPSYPAAHGALSGATSAALAALFPRDAAVLNGLADEAGQARIWGGIHYPSDVVVGLALGRAVARRVVDRMGT
jgi:membrane-associated phospholipid phosphatase